MGLVALNRGVDRGIGARAARRWPSIACLAVSACNYIDVFHSWPPYVLPNDDIKNVTRRAAEVGADTILITGARLVSTEGKSYKCQ